MVTISDDNFFLETKEGICTGYGHRLYPVKWNDCRLCSQPYGSLRRRRREEREFGGGLTARGCEKAADFVNFCDAFNIPVLTLVNVNGYQAVKCTEKKIAKAAARLTYAFANATVPKVTVITGKAYRTRLSDHGKQSNRS